MRYIAVALCVTYISACGGGSSAPVAVLAPISPVAPITYQKPSSSICDASSDVTAGLLCAIAPSSLDVNSRDVFGNGSVGDMNIGFGYHAIAFPETGTPINGIYIHLIGSYGRPYDPITDRFESALLLEESLAAGYVSIQLAYNNRFSVGLDECSSIAGLTVDNCSGDVRTEKITGVDVSSVTDTPLEDSIQFRLQKLAEYFDSQDVVLPVDIVSNNTVNWESLKLGGHSQGGTHALFIAKYFAAQSVCLLAGGYDVPDLVPNAPSELLADWLLDDSVILDIDNIRALVAVDDPFRDVFLRAYDHLGLIEGVHYREFSGVPYFDTSGALIDGHSAVVRDERFSTQRADACF